MRLYLANYLLKYYNFQENRIFFQTAYNEMLFNTKLKLITLHPIEHWGSLLNYRYLLILKTNKTLHCRQPFIWHKKRSLNLKIIPPVVKKL